MRQLRHDRQQRVVLLAANWELVLKAIFLRGGTERQFLNGLAGIDFSCQHDAVGTGSNLRWNGKRYGQNACPAMGAASTAAQTAA
jgi:hypothetical protein